MEKKEPSEKLTYLVRLFERDNKVRGAYLVQAITIEAIITDLISFHFCENNEKRFSLVSLVLNDSGITFAKKIMIFDTILKSDYSNIHKKYPKLKNRLEKINKFRNLLAHGMPSYSQKFLKEKIEDQIILAKFKKGKRMEYSIKNIEVESKIKETYEIITVLLEILTVIQVVGKKIKF